MGPSYHLEAHTHLNSLLQKNKANCGWFEELSPNSAFFYSTLRGKHARDHDHKALKEVHLRFNQTVVSIDKCERFEGAYLVVAAPVAALQKIRLGSNVPEDVVQRIEYLVKTVTPKASMRVFVKLKNSNLAAMVRAAAEEMLQTHKVSYLHVLTTVENGELSPLWSMISQAPAAREGYDFLLAYCDSDAAEHLYKMTESATVSCLWYTKKIY
ncbi:hypothetical protein CYMTET_35596 [Cymbomonas tetramitiformis]|uniref:Uncharacterized protein n=1 Tax=Cymbomonas tetramitiformis TaxID=36881 RepID=A0AAE0KNL9_9CHLO|nr:hypothetical protein CYMTET_35596 [Cymbomonas tetramitiformis]